MMAKDGDGEGSKVREQANIKSAKQARKAIRMARRVGRM